MQALIRAPREIHLSFSPFFFVHHTLRSPSLLSAGMKIQHPEACGGQLRGV